ncbi:UNVERIFIED_CONTAM: hypothetical protein FKN15_044204 [Acipenser sinensis]
MHQRKSCPKTEAEAEEEQGETGGESGRKSHVSQCHREGRENKLSQEHRQQKQLITKNSLWWRENKYSGAVSSDYGLSQPASSEGAGGEGIAPGCNRRLKSGSHDTAGVESRAAGAPDSNLGGATVALSLNLGLQCFPVRRERSRVESLFGAAANPSLSCSQQTAAKPAGAEQLKTATLEHISGAVTEGQHNPEHHCTNRHGKYLYLH